MPELPIGSIIAYAGVVTHAWEEQNGWLRCDGRLLDSTQPDNVALFEAIGFAWGGDGDFQFNVPDLQGFFLRGVDPIRQQEPLDTRVPFPADPDRDQRFPIRFGGNHGNKVGSAQLFGTALPQGTDNKFITKPAGMHVHFMNFETAASRDVNGQNNTVAYPSLYGIDRPEFWPETHPAKDHRHDIEGGNNETRPLNAYVHWIIRARVIAP